MFRRSLFDDRCFVEQQYSPDASSIKRVVNHVKRNIERVSSFKEGRPVLLSLSGGVDSMVLFDIFRRQNIPFSCVHIDYANRPESVEEANHLRSFCESESVSIDVTRLSFTRDGTEHNRSQYENETKRIRFDSYRKLCSEMGTNMVCLGHHDDDLIENVICNVFQLQSITDLGKMHEETQTGDGLLVLRPLLGLTKRDVYNYAAMNHVLYFKDSTPKWSKRGQIRDSIMPCFEKTFPAAKDQLIRFNDLNSSRGRIIEHALEPYVDFDRSESSNGETCLRIPMNLNDHSLAREIGFWKHVFNKATQMLQCGEVHQKAMMNFMRNMRKDKVVLNKRLRVENSEGVFTLVKSELENEEG